MYRPSFPSTPRRILASSLALTLSTTCLANDHAPFPISEVDWKDTMGGHAKFPNTLLTLMSRGFIGMPFMGDPTFCDDMDQQIADWIKAHPNARVVPVSLLPLGDEFSFMYVWIVDGAENLNLLLVRNGCCTAEQQAMTEMGQLLITKDETIKFAAQVEQAQQLAIQKKSGIWAKKGFDREAHWQNAERLERAEKYEEAIAEFRSTLDAGPYEHLTWLRIARCYDKLGRLADAIVAYDKSIELDKSEGGRLARIEKAECISRHDGPEKADAVFESVTAKCADDLEPCSDFASALAGQQRFDAAMQTLESAISSFKEKQKLAFDDDRFVLDVSRIGGHDQYWLNLYSLASALSTLATYSQYAKNWDKAFQYASQGLAIDQAVKTHLRDRYDSLTAEAGDFHCRLVRANVFMQRNSFAEAKKEIDYAKVLVDVGNIQGGLVKQTLEHAYAELGRQFPNEKVEVPPAYKPKPRQPEPPKPEALPVATSDALINMAKADDPATSFAALEELVARSQMNEIPKDAIDQLIEDGLTLQGDAKHRWRSQYGVFIERAQESGALSPDQWIRYLRQSIVVSEFAAEYSNFDLDKENKVRVTIDQTIQARIGGSLRDRDKPKTGTRLCATVSILRVELDGAEVAFAGPGDSGPKAHTWEMSAGVESGFATHVKNTNDLAPGAHTMAVTYRFEVRSGDRCQTHRGAEPSEPLVSWDHTERDEFAVPE